MCRNLVGTSPGYATKEPATLNVRHVADKAEQGQVGRWAGSGPQLLIVETCALTAQRRSVIVEPLVEHGLLISGRAWLGPVGWCDQSSLLALAG